MQIAGRIVRHVEEWGTKMDFSSACMCKKMIVEALNEHQSVSELIDRVELREEFDTLFEYDVARAEAAVDVLDARIKELTPEETKTLRATLPELMAKELVNVDPITVEEPNK